MSDHIHNLTTDEVSLAQSAALDLLRALKVLTLTPHIHAYLEEHDPKGLEQAERAIRLASEAPPARPQCASVLGEAPNDHRCTAAAGHSGAHRAGQRSWT